MSRRASIAGLRGLSKRVAELGQRVADEREARRGEERRALALRILGDPEALEAALEFADWVQGKEWPGGCAASHSREPFTAESFSVKIAGWLEEDPKGVEIVQRSAAALQRMAS